MADPSNGERIPVILLDRIGYACYQDHDGRRFLPSDAYAVRLVTGLDKIHEAIGPELQSVVAVERLDEAALREAIRFQAGFGGRPAARLVAVTERIMLFAARMRAECGIDGPTEAEILPFRDKIHMKRQVEAHGIRVPEFRPFSADAALELLARHGRIVAKPVLGSGAVDVYVIDDADDLAAFAARNSGRLDEFEVEQFIDGELFHVDSVVQDAHVVVAIAARYLDPTTSYLTLHDCRDVSVPAGPLLDRLLAFNQSVIATYPGFTGVTHHEMFVAADGIYFCEIGARAGGGGVIAAFESRTGINLDEAAVQAQLTATVPNPRPIEEHSTGFVVIYAGPGRIEKPIHVPDKPWVLEAQILAEPGATLAAPVNCNDAIAIVTVRGDNEAEVIARMAQVSESVRAGVATDD